MAAIMLDTRGLRQRRLHASRLARILRKLEAACSVFVADGKSQTRFILKFGEKMIDQETYRQLKAEIELRTASDRLLLDKLRADVRPLATAARGIHARSATAVSLVATDGGNNSLRFDPFMVQVVRVVDSNNNECA